MVPNFHQIRVYHPQRLMLCPGFTEPSSDLFTNLFIYGHETLETKTLGRIISHSTMDPGDDEYGTTTTLTCRSLNCLNSDRMSIVLTKLVNIGGRLGIKIYDDVTIYSVVFETAQTPIDIISSVSLQPLNGGTENY